MAVSLTITNLAEFAPIMTRLSLMSYYEDFTLLSMDSVDSPNLITVSLEEVLVTPSMDTYREKYSVLGNTYLYSN